MELAGAGGLRVRRTDVVPDGARAALVGLTFSGPSRRVVLSVDAHSELLSAYPWGWTTPSQETVNLPDTGGFDGRNLVFRETAAGERPHDYAAVVGSGLTPDGHALGPGHRGPAGTRSGLPGGRSRAAALRRRSVRPGHRRAG